MSAMLAKAVRTAIVLLGSEKARKAAAWAVAAVLSPLILLAAVLVSLLSTTTEHNQAMVSLCFHGGDIPEKTPAEYVEYIEDMRRSFTLLDSAMDAVNDMTEGELRHRLGEKLKERWDTYRNSLLTLSAEELIKRAEEIAAMQVCYSEFCCIESDLDRNLCSFLLQRGDPLSAMSEAWREHQNVDVGETFQSLLDDLYRDTRPDQVQETMPQTAKNLLETYPHDSVANDDFAKGIMRVPDMLLILFVLGHGKSPFLNSGGGRQRLLLSPS